MKTWKCTVRDWGGDDVVETWVFIKRDTIPTFCYDGGRVEFSGDNQTHWVHSNSFSVEYEEVK
jgi:hypothetical protein